MAWIESHQELARHPKTKRLARAAGIQIPAAIGHLHLLWWWALDYAQSGDLTNYTPEDIADAVLWEGDPATFMDALIEAGFIDQEDEQLFIHDWHDYAGKLLERRAKDRERKRTSSAIPVELQRKSIGKSTASDSTVPNPTVPNQQNSTEHDRTVPDPTEQTEPTPAPTPRKRKRTKAPDPDKLPFGEFVSMTNDEHASLVAKLGEQGAARCIEILDNYKGANGKKYDSDYRAILNWVVARYEEELAKGGQSRGQTTPVGGGYGKPAAPREDWSSFKPSAGFKRSSPDGE